MPTEPPVDIVDHTPLSCPPLRTRNATWSFVPGASVTPTRNTFTQGARASMPMAPLAALVWILRFSTSTSGASIANAALPVETICAIMLGAFTRDADAVRGRRVGGGSHQQHGEE